MSVHIQEDNPKNQSGATLLERTVDVSTLSHTDPEVVLQHTLQPSCLYNRTILYGVSQQGQSCHTLTLK